jgi:hypothetical protein
MQLSQYRGPEIYKSVTHSLPHLQPSLCWRAAVGHYYYSLTGGDYDLQKELMTRMGLTAQFL